MKKVLSLVIILLLLPVLVRANDASMGRKGETVYPMEETDIRMVSEDIYIEYATGHVRCEFVFENSGETKTVLMGFPAEAKIDYDALTTKDRVRLRNFTAYKNGVYIEVDEVTSSEIEGDFSKYPSWYVFEVTFKENEILTMTHDYDVSFTFDSIGVVYVGYILETGSTWGGTLGHTKVTFDLSDMYPWGIGIYSYPSLNSFRYKDGKLTFEKSDYIPDFNLELQIFGPASKNYSGTVWPEQADDFETSKQFFDNSSEASAEGLIKAYNEFPDSYKFIETVYLNTILGISDKQYVPIATKMEKDSTNRFLIYIKDRNFDVDDKTTITLMGKSENVIKTDDLIKTSSFGDYGTTIYIYKLSDENVKEAVANNLVSSYVVNVIDEEGNESKTVFAADDFDNSRTTIISGVPDDGSEGYEIVNPPTSESASNESLALAFVLLGTVLFIFNRKNK